MSRWSSRIVEVKIGATKSEGGSRNKVIVVGGESDLPLFGSSEDIPHPPVISMDVFDCKIPLPKVLKEPFSEVLEDPAEWAKLCVNKYGADLISLHLVSTDPNVLDRSPKEAAKTVEEVLQAVKVPLIIGGSGNPEKDPKVFEEVAKVAEGERCLLASATLDVYKEIAAAALAYGHSVVAFTPVDVNLAKHLNRMLMSMGLPPNRIVMDPTAASLGYGHEYSFSVIERIRLGGLQGDKDLQMPILVGVTNAWGAREAWLKDPSLGPREYRGPIWEAVTGVTYLLAGADILMMMHPIAVSLVKRVINNVFRGEKIPTKEVHEWLKEVT